MQAYSQGEKQHTLSIIYNISTQSGVKYSEQAAIVTLIVVSVDTYACFTL